MGLIEEGIGSELAQWLERQPVFFVATAPLDPHGHVNCSPKGNRGEFAVLGPTTVAYLDQTGSGVETIAHLKDNGRVTIMFCAFTGSPRIVRLYGSGTVAALGSKEFEQLIDRFDTTATSAVRAVVSVKVERVADSCGFGVPLMSFHGHRRALDAWAAKKGPAGLDAYRLAHNAHSIDGLDGLHPGEQSSRGG